MSDHTEYVGVSRSSDPGRPLSELRETGLLWLINRQVFHPRGWAFCLHVDGDGNVTGWSLQGDGVETWTFGAGTDEDAHLAAVNRLLAPLTEGPATYEEHMEVHHPTDTPDGR